MLWSLMRCNQVWAYYIFERKKIIIYVEHDEDAAAFLGGEGKKPDL